MAFSPVPVGLKVKDASFVRSSLDRSVIFAGLHSLGCGPVFYSLDA